MKATGKCVLWEHCNGRSTLLSPSKLHWKLVPVQPPQPVGSPDALFSNLSGGASDVVGETCQVPSPVTVKPSLSLGVHHVETVRHPGAP